MRRRLISALPSSRCLPCIGVGGRAAMLPRPPALVAARALLSSRTSGAEPPLAESFPVSAATAVEAVRAPPEAASRFAIIALGGAQYKVAPDDLIVVEKLALPVGADLAARRVLLVGERSGTVIGSPLIEGAAVHATVEEQGYGPKVIIFKKRRRKGYRRWRGYRARLTMLRINSIELPEKLEKGLAAAAKAAG